MAAKRATKAPAKKAPAKEKATSAVSMVDTGSNGHDEGLAHDADARRLLVRFVQALERAHPQPPKTKHERALHDAWSTILRERLPRVRRQLSDLARAARWEFGGDDAADHLLPSHWHEAVRGLTASDAALQGALQQYGTVRLVWRPPLFVGHVGSSTTSFRRWDETATDLRRRDEAEKRATDRRAAQEKRYEDVMRRVQEAWAETRARLEAQVQELRAIVGLMQRQEEARLARRVERLAPGSEVQDDALALLHDLRIHRLDGELDDFRTRLRTWQGTRTRLVSLFEGPP